MNIRDKFALGILFCWIQIMIGAILIIFTNNFFEVMGIIEIFFFTYFLVIIISLVPKKLIREYKRSKKWTT